MTMTRDIEKRSPAVPEENTGILLRGRGSTHQILTVSGQGPRLSAMTLTRKSYECR